MGISVRTMLTTGVCGVTAGAIVLAPSAAQPRASFAPAFSYTAYSLGSADPHTKITPETMRDAVDFIESIGPSPTGGSSSTTAPAITGFTAPPIAAVDDDGQVEVQNVASDVIETPQEVADTIGRALQFVPRQRLFPCTNCGLAPMSREVAVRKLEALAKGAALARERYGR